MEEVTAKSVCFFINYVAGTPPSERWGSAMGVHPDGKLLINAIKR